MGRKYPNETPGYSRMFQTEMAPLRILNEHIFICHFSGRKGNPLKANGGGGGGGGRGPSHSFQGGTISRVTQRTVLYSSCIPSFRYFI